MGGVKEKRGGQMCDHFCGPVLGPAGGINDTHRAGGEHHACFPFFYITPCKISLSFLFLSFLIKLIHNYNMFEINEFGLKLYDCIDYIVIYNNMLNDSMKEGFWLIFSILEILVALISEAF